MKKYTEYMDNISVDAELHGKIMNRITQKPAPVYRSRAIFSYSGLAACAAVLIICVFTIPGLFSSLTVPDGGGSGNPPSSGAGSMTPSLGTGSMTPPLTTATHGVHIPAIPLPEKPKGAETDMIGLFVYQGRIYTQAAWYYGGEANALVGKRVGYATGNINEWSTQDEYAAEFAGSVAGNVYSVKGYDEKFRLCMTGNYTDDDGNNIQYVNFYENLNNISLAVGSDLFGDRIQLREKWKTVRYQEHDNWNNHTTFDSVYHDLKGVSYEDIAAFIDTLYKSEFEYVYETVGHNNFYTPDRRQAHVNFNLSDNTVVEMRLFEGGYAGYRHLGWYFVKMSGEAFDAIFNACQ